MSFIKYLMAIDDENAAGLPDGLLAYYSFNNQDGTNDAGTLPDLVQVGSLNYVDLGGSNYALNSQLSGNDGFTTPIAPIAAAIEASNSFTLAARVYRPTGTSGNGSLCLWRIFDNWKPSLGLILSSTTLIHRYPSGSSTIQINVALPADVWVDIRFVCDNGAAKVFFNDVEMGSKTANVGFADTTRAFIVGNSNPQAGDTIDNEPFQGQIDYLIVASEALTQTDVDNIVGF